MRRQRSQTIEAQSYDELLQLSKATFIGCSYRPRKGVSESLYASKTIPRRSSHISQKLANMRKKSSQFNRPTVPSTNYWDDMDFDSQLSLAPLSRRSSFFDNKITMQAHNEDMDTEPQLSESEDSMKAEQSVNQVKVMVIGDKGSGRHTFINTLFGSSEEEEHRIRTTLDLVVKKKESENTIDIFKFWIKDASSQEFEHLVKSYYKTVELFIFLYQVDDRRSFECLDQAIKKAQEEVGGGRFVGLLVGGARGFLSGCSRAVQHHEGQELKNKYGLCNFLELNFAHGEDQERLLGALTSHELSF